MNGTITAIEADEAVVTFDDGSFRPFSLEYDVDPSALPRAVVGAPVRWDLSDVLNPHLLILGE